MQATSSEGWKPFRGSMSSTPSTALKPGPRPTSTWRRWNRNRWGPTSVLFLGHSDIRTATMGLPRATATMSALCTNRPRWSGCSPGARRRFVGMSSQQLLFDKLDGETCRSRTLPSTYAKPRELRRLKSQLRRRGRVLQSGPDIQNPIDVASQVAQSLPVLPQNRRPACSPAADIKANPLAVTIMGPLARVMNKLGGDFRWQHLPIPFEVYADGIDLVVFEEFGSGAAALHLRDEVERNALLGDEEYRRRFRREYDRKFGIRVWHRDFFDAEIVSCPDESVVSKSFGKSVSTVAGCIRRRFPRPRGRARHEGAVADDDLNHRPDVLKKLARDPGVQMGFSGCRSAFAQHGFLQLRVATSAACSRREPCRNSFMTVEQAVHRPHG